MSSLQFAMRRMVTYFCCSLTLAGALVTVAQAAAILAK